MLRVYSQSPTSTVTWLPQRWFAVGLPRRRFDSSMMSSWIRVALWMNSTTAP